MSAGSARLPAERCDCHCSTAHGQHGACLRRVPTTTTRSARRSRFERRNNTNSTAATPARINAVESVLALVEEQLDSNTIPFRDGRLSEWLNTQLPLQVGVGSSFVGNPVGTDPDKESWYSARFTAQKNLVGKLTSGVSAATTALTTLVHRTIWNSKPSTCAVFYPNDPLCESKVWDAPPTSNPTEGLLCRLPSQTVSAFNSRGHYVLANSSGGTNIQNQIPVLTTRTICCPAVFQQLTRKAFSFRLACLRKNLGRHYALPAPRRHER